LVQLRDERGGTGGRGCIADITHNCILVHFNEMKQFVLDEMSGRRNKHDNMRLFLVAESSDNVYKSVE
jgi:hypothetical protein